MTTKQRKRIYRLLIKCGHTPVKAASIILDATRELRRKSDNPVDRWAIMWIRMLFRQRHNEAVKVARDAALFGIGYSIDDKHIPIEKVRE
jgi:hypothetical protein